MMERGAVLLGLAGLGAGLILGMAASWLVSGRGAAARARRLAAHGHDLRGPLTAILGFSEMMREQVFGPLGSDRYLGYARDIHVAGRTLANRIEAVMDLIRLDAGLIRLRRGRVDVTAALEAVLAQAEARGQGPQDLVLDLPAACPALSGDRWAAERVFGLLLAAAAGRPATLKVAVEDRRLALALTGGVPDACGLALLTRLVANLHGTMDAADDGVMLWLPIFGMRPFAIRP